MASMKSRSARRWSAHWRSRPSAPRPCPPSSSGRASAKVGGGREEREETPAPVEPAATAAPIERKSGFSFGDAFGLLKQAIGRLGGEERPMSAEELRDAMAEIQT